MSFLKSIVIAFSMFSRIQMPRVEWNAKNMRYMMACFPLVGLVIGAAEFGFLWITGGIPFMEPILIPVVGCALVPLLITGGIHLDGFCDTVDALSSHADREKKLEIMKDPHIGAFGAIAMAAYLLLYTALMSEFYSYYCWDEAILFPFFLSFVLSRALSGLAVVWFPCAKDSGLAKTFADASARRACGIILLAIFTACAAAMIFASAIGVFVVLAAIAVFFYYRRVALREFGGITGDTAGWFLQICELAMLAALVISAILHDIT